MINRELIIDVLTKHIGDLKRVADFEVIAADLMKHTDESWLSIWEHHPDKNGHGIEHASAPVLWIDASDTFGPYGKPFVHTGNFYFLEEQLYEDAFVSYHGDGRLLLKHPTTGKKRDLYWKPLPVYNFPEMKQR